jgi:diadenosine tetraphosphate (Ap4A) HIT family hydrolase
MNNLYTLWEAKQAGVAPWTDEVQNTDEFVVYRDQFPVTETGHFLVVPKKNTNQEIEKAVRFAITVGQENIMDAANPVTGFNIGINWGESAGQTVGFPHVHLILRSDGDCEDPTGGVRNVIPGKGNYKQQDD